MISKIIKATNVTQFILNCFLGLPWLSFPPLSRNLQLKSVMCKGVVMVALPANREKGRDSARGVGGGRDSPMWGGDGRTHSQ